MTKWRTALNSAHGKRSKYIKMTMLIVVERHKNRRREWGRIATGVGGVVSSCAIIRYSMTNQWAGLNSAYRTGLITLWMNSLILVGQLKEGVKTGEKWSESGWQCWLLCNNQKIYRLTGWNIEFTMSNRSTNNLNELLNCSWSIENGGI